MAVIDCSAPLGNPSLIEAWALVEAKIMKGNNPMSGSKSQTQAAVAKPVEAQVQVSQSKPIETPVTPVPATVQPKAVGDVKQEQLLETIRQQQFQLSQLEQMLRIKEAQSLTRPAAGTDAEDDDDDRQIVIIQAQPSSNDDAAWIPWVAGAAIGAAAVGAGVLIYNMFND